MENKFKIKCRIIWYVFYTFKKLYQSEVEDMPT